MLVFLVILKVIEHICLQKFRFGVKDKSFSHLVTEREISQSVLTDIPYILDSRLGMEDLTIPLL